MAPKLVVFDMAGTTVQDGDGVVNHALQTALLAYGVTVTHSQVNDVMGLPKPDAIRHLLQDTPVPIAKIYQTFEDEMVRYYAVAPEVKAIEGAYQVFGELRRLGIKVVLDTGFARPIVDVILDRLEWRTAVDATVASDEVLHGRPHADLILEAMARTGVLDVQRVAKVGDTPSDVQEGHAAGCKWVIAVTEGSHSAEQLRAYKPTHMIPNITHVLALFRDA